MVKRLGDILSALEPVTLIGNPETEIRQVAYDSRRVGSGALFVAIRGLIEDGRRYVPQAVEAGASAILTDGPLESDPGVPVLMVENARAAMSRAAAALHDYPGDRLTLIGITGTNGKTTTTYILETILERAGLSAGVIGTVNFRFPGDVRPAPNTTPEGPDLQGILSEMIAAGVGHVMMEVSSHGLELHRVDGCAFDLGVFTNLTQDHLDFHRDLRTYFKAKRRLFLEHLTGDRLADGPRAVINVDDAWGMRLAAELGDKALTFGLNNQADIRARDIEAGRRGIRAALDTPWGEIAVRSSLLGEVNLYNLMTAASVALRLGIPRDVVAAGLAESQGAPGRLERVGSRDDFLVLVDYAHSPDALERVLKVARELNPNRLISVFGCGGDRDRTKRPMMGAAAGRLSDLAIVTSDNPRTEDPLLIIRDIEEGIGRVELNRLDPERLVTAFPLGSYTVVPDRRMAIHLACRVMDRGDILIVAGKGHEDYQILGKEKIHFDDREEARNALEEEGRL